MFTELKGSSLNQVVKVKPVSWGHLESGGTITALPAFPGKEKKTSGPDLKKIWLNIGFIFWSLSGCVFTFQL